MTQMDQTDRLLALLQRELRGCEISLHEHPHDLPEATLSRELDDGRRLVVVAGPDSPSSATLAQKLDALLDCFGETLSSAPELESSSPRPSVEVALQRELEALVLRVGAADAFVIDVDSPVLWGSASAGHLPEVRPPRPRRPGPRRGALQLVVDQDTPTPSALPPASEHALAALRDRPDLDSRRQGGRSRFVSQRDPGRFLARGFADIYLLVVAFDGPFDEIRTERILGEVLPRVERLVLALPPLDPDHGPRGRSNVIALNKKK